MVTSFKRSHARTATLSAANPAAGHRQPTSLLESPGHSWASLGQSLVGSLLLSPGSWCIQGSVCALQESVSCVSSGGSMVGLMVTSSKRAYAIPRSIAPRAPAPASLGDTQTQFWLSLWVPVRTVSPFLPSCWASPLPLDVGYLFLVGSNILLSTVVQQRVVILEFPREKMRACPFTPPS